MLVSGAMADFASRMPQFRSLFETDETSRLAVTSGMAAITFVYFVGIQVRHHDFDAVGLFGFFGVMTEVFILMLVTLLAGCGPNISVFTILILPVHDRYL